MRKEISFLDYFEVLVKWRWFLIRNSIVAIVLFIVISLIWPKTYRAESLIIPKSTSNSNLMSMFGDVSMNLLEESQISANNYETIINSFNLRNSLIEEFDLFEVYNIDKYESMMIKLDNVIEVESDFTGGLGYQEIYALKIIVYDEDPVRAAKMNNFILNEFQKIVTEIDIQKSTDLKEFLGGRVDSIQEELKQAEDSLTNFQMEHGIIQPYEQTKAIIENIAQLKYELIGLEIQKNVLAKKVDRSHPELEKINQQVEALKGQYESMLISKKRKPNDIFLSVDKIPNNVKTYYRIQREIEIKNKLLEYLIPQYEKAKIQEQKSVPTINIVDYAHIPDWKYRPKRSIIVIAGLLITLLISWLYILLIEYYQRTREEDPKKFEKIKNIKNEFRGNLFGMKKK